MKRTFRLEGLECANCAAKIERLIRDLDGVTNATVNFMTTRLTIEAAVEKMDAIVDAVRKIMARIEPDVVVKKA